MTDKDIEEIISLRDSNHRIITHEIKYGLS